MLDWDDKASVCRMAKEVWEPQFMAEIAPQDGLDARPNPECAENFCAPDMIVNGELADLKWRCSPVYQAQELYGVPGQYAVTLNTNKVSRYMQNWPEMKLYVYLEWPRQQVCIHGRRYAVSRKRELWVLTIEKLAQLVWHLPIHTYRERAAGNATASYVLNILEGERLSRHGEDIHGHGHSAGGRRRDMATHPWLAAQPGQSAPVPVS